MIVLTQPNTRMKRLVRSHGMAARRCTRISPYGYLSRSSAVISGAPFSACCWFRSSSTAQQDLISLGASTNDQPLFRLALSLSTSGRLGIHVRNTVPQTQITETTTSFVTGQWHHAAGVFRASNSRTAYLDGGGAATGTDDRTPTLLDRTGIGALIRASAGVYFEGQIAVPCVWNVALSLAEVQSLARGVPPWEIRPESIVSCLDMESLWDPYLNATWTNSGTTIAEGPKLWKPTKRLFVPQSSGTTSKAGFFRHAILGRRG